MDEMERLLVTSPALIMKIFGASRRELNMRKHMHVQLSSVERARTLWNARPASRWFSRRCIGRARICSAATATSARARTIPLLPDDEENSAAGGAPPELPEQEDVLVHSSEEDHSANEQVRAQPSACGVGARRRYVGAARKHAHAVRGTPSLLARGREAHPARPAARPPGTRRNQARRQASACDVPGSAVGRAATPPVPHAAGRASQAVWPAAGGR